MFIAKFRGITQHLQQESTSLPADSCHELRLLPSEAKEYELPILPNIDCMKLDSEDYLQQLCLLFIPSRPVYQFLAPFREMKPKYILSSPTLHEGPVILTTPSLATWSEGIVMFWLSLIIGIIPLTIVGAISHFEVGSSTIWERAWTMAWLISGIFFGTFLCSPLNLAKCD
jgi:hypothetical protein